MHELSVCESLIREVARLADAHDAREVRRITVAIGPLSGIEIPQLEAAFTIARAGSCAAGAELEIERTGLAVRCRECGARTEASVQRLLCGACGSWRTTLESGDEILLRTIELNKAPAKRTEPCAKPAAAP